jgi:ATP-dependent DNA helicase RecG
MKKIGVFISSVQGEFSEERRALYEYLLSDALLGRFFDPFIFENLPAFRKKFLRLHLIKGTLYE